jgi:hypothetical protein
LHKKSDCENSAIDNLCSFISFQGTGGQEKLSVHRAVEISLKVVTGVVHHPALDASWNGFILSEL